MSQGEHLWDLVYQEQIVFSTRLPAGEKLGFRKVCLGIRCTSLESPYGRHESYSAFWNHWSGDDN